MGLKAFRKVQISNPENTIGTAEAAVEQLLGTVTTWEGGETIHRPQHDDGSLSRNRGDAIIVGEEAHCVWQGDVNSRHIIWALAMALCGNITPTQPDSTNEPNAYLWTFTPALTSPGNGPSATDGIDTFTMEYGDDEQAWEMEYCFATSIEISGAPNEPCTFSVSVTGRQKTDTTFTAALSLQSVQYFPFNLSKFYVNDAGGNHGTTQKSDLLKGFTWRLNTQFTPQYAGDGSLYFSSVAEDEKFVELSLTYKHDDESETERGYAEDLTIRNLRIELRGETELDTGQSNVPYIYLDGAYQYNLPWPSLSDMEGQSTVEVAAQSCYDSSWAKEYQVAVLTDLDAYPT